MTYSQFFQTSINLDTAKQGLLSRIPISVVHMNFVVNSAEFFRTPMLYNIDNHIQNKCSEKSRKNHGKTPALESLFNKAVGLRPLTLLKRHFNTCFPVNFENF